MRTLVLISSNNLLSRAIEQTDKPMHEIKLAHIITASKDVDDNRKR